MTRTPVHGVYAGACHAPCAVPRQRCARRATCRLRRVVGKFHSPVWPSVDLKYAVPSKPGAYHSPVGATARSRSTVACQWSHCAPQSCASHDARVVPFLRLARQGKSGYAARTLATNAASLTMERR